MRIERVVRPWATAEGPHHLDSVVMERRDRLANLGDLRGGRRRLGPGRARRHDTRPDRRPGRGVPRRRAHRPRDRAHHDPDLVARRLRSPPGDLLPGRLDPRGAARRLDRADRRGLHRAAPPGRPGAADRPLHHRPRGRRGGHAVDRALTARPAPDADATPLPAVQPSRRPAAAARPRHVDPRCPCPTCSRPVPPSRTPT